MRINTSTFELKESCDVRIPQDIGLQAFTAASAISARRCRLLPADARLSDLCLDRRTLAVALCQQLCRTDVHRRGHVGPSVAAIYENPLELLVARRGSRRSGHIPMDRNAALATGAL